MLNLISVKASTGKLFFVVNFKLVNHPGTPLLQHIHKYSNYKNKQNNKNNRKKKTMVTIIREYAEKQESLCSLDGNVK